LSKTNQDLLVLGRAIEEYHRNEGAYPEFLGALIQSATGEPVLSELVLDAWEHPYSYRKTPNASHPFILVCLGADGAPGGAGDAADTDYWELSSPRK
jgi:general secretion pathway protein G